MEDVNEDKIYLYKAGKFWKAYNQSAYLFHTYIQSFKLSCRIVQKINRKVVSLGFPEDALKKYTYNYLVEKMEDECLRVHIGKRVDETSFDQWMEMAFIEATITPQYTPSTSMIEHQPVYKTAYDLLTQIYQCTGGLSKNIRNPLGLRAKELSYEIAYGIRILYDVPDRSVLIDSAQGKCDDLLLNYQTLRDLREITPDCFALLCEGTFPFATVLCTTCCIATFPGGPTASCGSARKFRIFPGLMHPPGDVRCILFSTRYLSGWSTPQT